MHRVKALRIGHLLLSLVSCGTAWAQSKANLSVPEIAKAGETVTFSGKLDRAPSFAGGAVMYTISGPEGFWSQSSIPIEPGIRNFTIVYSLPAAAKGGSWSIGHLFFFDGVNRRPLSSDEQPFLVVSDSSLTYPTSAEIEIKPSQLQLLHAEAISLQDRIQTLKAKLRTLPPSEAPRELLDTLTFSELRVAHTRLKYETLGSRSMASDQYFSDIRTSYREAIANIPRQEGAYKQSSLAQAHPQESTSSLSLLSQASLRALEQNELAYQIVVDAESLAFDLEVRSTPPGATISYGLRGDQTFKRAPDTTNTTIRNIPFAIWIVRVEIPGLPIQEKEHNALTESNHVLNFDVPRAP